jgi:hypothetical protein
LLHATREAFMRRWGVIATVVAVAASVQGNLPRSIAAQQQAQAASPDHRAYTSIAANALDWCGTWKWLDSLMARAFAGD